MCVDIVRVNMLAQRRCTSLGRRIEKYEVEIKRIARQGQHPSQLARPQNADFHAGSFSGASSRTFAVCVLRNFASFVASRLSVVAKIAAASREIGRGTGRERVCPYG